MNRRRFPALGLGAVCCLLVAAAVGHAQMSNANYTLIQDMVSSAGGPLGGGNPMRLQTVLGLPAAGKASNSTYALFGGIGPGETFFFEPVTATITITGTVDDPSSSVTVNGTEATIEGSNFTVAGFLLIPGPNTITAVATDGAGNEGQHAVTVYLDLPDSQKTADFTINVTGEVDDPSATVSVNDLPAAVDALGQFIATVPLAGGLNTLTATATDAAGNQQSVSIHVFVPLPLRPPSMPTVGTSGPTIPAFTTQSAVTIGGTKTPGTSIWINGEEVWPLDDAETWTATVLLVEGDNEFIIVTKDALGTTSAEVRLVIVLDQLPPVLTITSQPPATTNLSPVRVTGTVDDSLTIVTVNGIEAQRNRHDFDVEVPIDVGPNTLTVKATSPTGWKTTQILNVERGTVPTVSAVSPSDGTTVYAVTPGTIVATASDTEGDPIDYQFLLDGTLLADWSSSTSQPWTPALTDLGRHVLEVNVRDAFGGSNTIRADVLVIHQPIQHE